MRWLVFGLSFFILFNVSGQNTDEELAGQYFSNGEYDKAVILYKKLHKKNNQSMYLYQNYLRSLIELKEFEEAEKVVSKISKKNPTIQVYVVDLGEVYRLQGKEKKTQSLYIDRIDDLAPDINTIDQLSSAFLKYDLYDFAELTLLKGRKLLRAPSSFHNQLLSIYYANGSGQKVVSECLEFLRFQPMEIENVKKELIPVLGKTKTLEFLQESLLSYAQKNPQNRGYDDLLMWVFVQQKKFNSAFRQAVAMDKRTKGEGKEVFELAKICMSNREYRIAEKCYQNLIDRGEDNYHFVNAQMGLLESSYEKTKSNPNPSDVELQLLVASYNDFLLKFGKDWNTASSMKDLADIHIFYTHDMAKGIGLLNELIKMPRVRSQHKAKYKLALADAYVITDEVWEAALLYGQVDKEFKEDPLGQEAKFRNARLSYYRGDFDWAKDQLDVLKTATTQLIANNAIELGLLIQDNTGLDSTTEALKEFSKAQLLLFQNKFDECVELLNLLPFKYPNHSLEDEIYFTKAQVMEARKDYKKAETFYLSVIDLFPTDILADNAIYDLAQMYEFKSMEPAKAKAMYEKLIFEYTGSLFVVEARKRQKLLDAETLENASP